MQVGKQSLIFEDAPFIVSSANIVGTKEGTGPLKEYFDVIGGDDLFGQNTWEEAESTLQKEAVTHNGVTAFLYCIIKLKS